MKDIKCNAIMWEWRIENSFEAELCPYKLTMTFKCDADFARYITKNADLKVKKTLKAIQTGEINIINPENL